MDLPEMKPLGVYRSLQPSLSKSMKPPPQAHPAESPPTSAVTSLYWPFPRFWYRLFPAASFFSTFSFTEDCGNRRVKIRFPAVDDILVTWRSSSPSLLKSPKDTPMPL